MRLQFLGATGMATGGRVLHHLKAYLPDWCCSVLFAGYQAAGTRGAALVVTRGEPVAADALRRGIEERLGWPCTVPEYLQSVTL
jgi:metallo-beta-lactamase family protein